MAQYDLLWISQHAAQSYPLADAAYGQVGSSVLPMSFLLDIQIYIPKSKIATLKNAFYVKSIVDNIDTYTLVIGCMLELDNGYTCLKAHGIPKTINMSTPLEDRYFILTADTLLISNVATKNVVSRFTGTVYIGITLYTDIPTLQFTHAQGQISPVCVQSTQGLDAIYVDGKQLHGVVKLLAGSGIHLSTTNSDLVTTIKVSIDKNTIYKGMGSVLTVVEAVKSKLGNPIQKINNIGPDATGAITISGMDCVEFASTNASDHIITVSNICSKPCCGSTYSLALKAQILVIKLLQSILRDYFVQQSNNINYIQASLATVIGAK